MLGAWLVAIVIVVAVFPDIVFSHASIRNSRVLPIFEKNPPDVHAWLPEHAATKPWSGYRDLGAAAWQLEPAQRFLHRAMEAGEGVDWNPYSASGTHGLERLASAPTSVITWTTALLGAETGALHLVLLLAYAVASFCLFRVLSVDMGRSWWASVGACFVFLLTGFHTSMLGAQMVHPYLLAPVLLLALLRFLDDPGPLRGLAATAASAAMLAETFMPTTILALLAVHGLCLLSGPLKTSDVWRRLVLQALPSILAFLLLAPIWFPILASVPLTEWEAYDQRDFSVASPVAALSVLTPQHFWESYSGYRLTEHRVAHLLPVTRIEGTRVYHLGLVVVFVAFQSFAGVFRRSPLVWGSAIMAVVGLARVFGVFPMTLVEGVPVFGRMSVQYWGLLVAISVVVLFAFGADSLATSRSLRRWPTLLFGLAVVLSVGVLLAFLGIPDEPLVVASLRRLALLLASVVIGWVLLHRWPHRRRLVAVAVCVVAIVELFSSMNTLRPRRAVLDPDSISYVAYVKDRLKPTERILNVGGRGIYPNWGSAFGISQIDSLDGVNLRWYDRFFDQRFGKTEHFLAIRGVAHGLPIPDGRLDLNALDLLGVRFVLVHRGRRDYLDFFERHGWRRRSDGRGVVVFENPRRPGPRAFLAGLVEAPGLPSDWGLDAGRVATSTDRRLLAEARSLGVAERPRLASRDAWHVRIVDRAHERLVFEVAARRPAVLVVAETWHPGWSVAVDGQPRSLGRVDEALRGVVVPAGYHRVVMTYRPLGRVAGLWVSWLALLAAGVLVVASRRARAGRAPRSGRARRGARAESVLPAPARQSM